MIKKLQQQKNGLKNLRNYLGRNFHLKNQKKMCIKKFKMVCIGWNWKSKFVGLHLQIKRKEEREVLKDEQI